MSVIVGLLCPEKVAEPQLGQLELHELGELASVVPGEGRGVAAPRRAVAVGHAWSAIHLSRALCHARFSG